MLRKVVLFVFAIVLSTGALGNTRFIIKYKPIEMESTNTKAQRLQMMMPISKTRIAMLTTLAGTSVTDLHPIATGAHVITVDKDLESAEAEKFIEKVQQDSNVEYIEEDRVLKPSDAPMETNPVWQWDMGSSGYFLGQPQWVGDNISAAWNILHDAGYNPGRNVTVGVLDTGYTPHPNFIDNLQNLNGASGVYGYQFISDCRMSGKCAPSTSSNAAENSLYTPDALDLGDYVSTSDINTSGGFFNSGCYNRNSSWHGSHVTGTIAANAYSSDDSTFITGGAYAAKVVPVRVLGKCGGYTSDIINGMLWASGFDVRNNNGATIPANPNPVQVINLSLGGYGACSRSQQDAINAVTNSGVVVVAAAGNNAMDVYKNNPANCGNVISVAAKGPTNALAPYSNFGNTSIAASGGDRSLGSCGSNLAGCASAIYSTIWSSPYVYQPVSQGGYGVFATYQGTSMATPHVVATVADMIGVLKSMNIPYTTYGIAEVLKLTAKPYNNCSTSGCASSGSLDAAAAIDYVLENKSVPAYVAPAPAPASGGGGGCSAIANGDDLSLILLLIGAGLYAYRRKNFKNKKC